MALKTVVFRFIQQKKLVNYAPIIFQCGKYHSNSEERRGFRKKLAVVLFGSVLVGKVVADDVIKSQNNISEKPTKKGSSEDKDGVIEAGAKKPGLPVYSAEEVSKHDSTASFWVTYKHGVYDVTSFLPSHPGGEQILNAAGLSIEPFWNVYGMHKTKEIYTLLESYRIGNLRDEDIVDHTDDEMWVKEPVRDRRLIIKTAKPFNAEIPMKLQVEHFDTPNELFYVRQHMPVPEVEAETHTLRINIAGRDDSVTFTLQDLAKFRQASVRAALMCAGNRRSEMNKDSVTFTLQDLAKFRQASVRAALMCAGNRRSEMNKQVKPVKGLSWQGGAIGNAVWSGVYLRDVLKHCGVEMEDTQGKHIIFTGSDIDATGHNFSTSIPLHMAVDPSSRILLATHMNGAVLPPDHGYPLRVVVPGAPAVRSVKWLGSTVIDIDATGHNFSTSIPLHMAVEPSSRILLATHMNGAVLPPDHGYPLRVVVPGAPAVRSVKWLESITIGEDESSSHWHKQDYRSFNPSKTWETADFATAPPVYSLPVTSAICDPADGETVKMKDGCIEIRDYRAFNPSKTWETADFATAPPVYSLPVTSAICDPADGDTVKMKDGCIEIRGYAYSGGGAKVLRVDLSTDRGQSWVEAECTTSDDAPPYHYSWALWTARLPAKRGEMELWVKATDSNFNTQPEKFDDIWNIRGILSNAYHKIKIQVD
ncbi:LOW QUALITY PROTEIN: sulfite oxidase, mitochondrial [Cydia splendana]|uniref:LOW QUALITY PROTEIN: sulfite oxidase, mitochondrial n=1 Tax=Cydia splendana TaxID=1100963 RepID=UPI00300DB52B